MSKEWKNERKVMKIWIIKIAVGYRGDNYHESKKLPEITGRWCAKIHQRQVVLSGLMRSPNSRGCKDGIGGKWLSNVWVRVCSAELLCKWISTYPVELTVILRRINLYLEVALSGMIWLFSYSMGMPRTHTRSVVWFSDALIALRMNNYNRKRLTEVIIAQSLNMHRSGSRV